MVIPGATMFSSQDCEKMSKKEAYDFFALSVEKKVFDRKIRKLVKEREVLHISTRKSRPARQNVSLSKEAYVWMTGNDSAPMGMMKPWKNMSKTKRLEYHLNLIAENFGAASFSYEVLDD